MSNIPDNLTAPIFTFDVESGGQYENENRMVLLGHGLSTGTLAEGALAICGSVTTARELAGRGSMLESMFIRARQNAPAQEIWLGRVADTGTAEIRTVTIVSVPAAGGQGVLQIAGEAVSISLDAGETVSSAATKLAAAINAYINPITKISLPVTASAAAAVVTLTARHKGTYATGLDVFTPVVDGGNAFADSISLATTTAGAGVPDVSTVLAAMNDDAFEMVVSAFGDDANRTVLDSFHNATSGRWSYAQQLYGHVFYPKAGTESELVTSAAAKDSWHVTMLPRFASGGFATPDYEWAAAFAARIAAWSGGGSNGDVSRNQTGLVVDGVKAPRDRAYWPDYATRESLLKNGVSSWKVDRSGNVMIDKLITQSQTINGVPDTTFRDVQKIYQLMYALKKFRADLAAEHANKAIADDNPANLPAIATVRDIKATLVHSYRQMAGILENADAAALTMSVVRNSDNPNRVDVVLPLDFINPLDIFAGLARVYSQFD